MKLKALQEQLRQGLMQSHQLYCCYCLEPQGSKISCCGENHFLAFRDLYEADQDYLLIEEASQVLYDVL
jgi:hypothetical protein